MPRLPGICCKSTLNPIGVIRAVSMAMSIWMDLHHFSGLLNRCGLWKFVQGLSAPFLPNPWMPISAIGNDSNLWPVVGPSTIPTTVHIKLDKPKDDSPGFKPGPMPAKSKKSSRCIQIAPPSIRFWGHNRNAFKYCYPPKAAIPVFLMCGGL